jgi:CheY-like chemotaxis protein
VNLSQGVNVEKLPVLVVEDNEDDVFILRRAFKEAQLNNPIHVVTDGGEAIDFLAGEGKFGDRSRYPFPVLVLLDLKLPLKSGLEVLEWIQAQVFRSDVNVIVLTSSAEERDITKAYHLGARSYLTKPPTARILREAMTALNDSLITKKAIDHLHLSDDRFVRAKGPANDNAKLKS